ncbi:trypsin-like serine protease [Oceanicola sp. D3]|uniref:trypsin-like serine peptidase n=1 Tax=Oceanicola sp. D3 TaxID=2587163 RepID=UPI00111CFF27|nr:trypsin-like serine protease [Oceanicola sp. D3]QDC10940.1 trypsin-like serine protease [Oceanicola sp. D3]
MRNAFLSALTGLLALASLPASAQETGLTSLATSDQGRGWEAVGRLEMGRKSFCTGALIAPDLVLTAAHCLYEMDTGARVDVSGVEFRAGWRNGRAEAYRGVRRAVTHPDYVYEGRDQLDRVALDVALLQLDRPIRNIRVTPFDTADAPGAGDSVSVISYAQDRAEAPAYESGCEVMERRGGVLMFTCSVDFGSSGAPIFTIGARGPQVASVVSAKATMQGRPVALGTELEPVLSVLMEQLSSGGGALNPGGTVRFLGGGNSGERREIGARFVKP